MIIDQQDRDNAVQDLLKKLSEVYAFMTARRLAEIPMMKDLYGKLARQTLECANFIVRYSETKNKCKSGALRHRHLIQCHLLCRDKACQEHIERNRLCDSELQ